jgi:hypothetical protein
MASLGKAIATENRRIRKVVLSKQYEREAEAVMPKHNINLKDRIADIYQKLLGLFEKREEKLAFSEICGKTKEERIYSFVSLLHLDNQQKVWLEQSNHFDEIWILLKHLYEQKYAKELEQMKKDVDEEFEKLAFAEQEKDAKAREKEKGKKKGFKKKDELSEGPVESEAETDGTDEKGDEFSTDKVENYEELENAKGFGNELGSAIENELEEEEG